MRFLLSSVLGGLIIFIWMAISWMILPWHIATLQKFNNETAVAEVLLTNAPKSGMYMLPSAASTEMTNIKPFMFSTLRMEGMSESMLMPMVLALMNSIIVAFLVSWMLSKTRGLDYLQRVGFVVVSGLAAFLFIDGAYWIWFHFDSNYLLVSLADAVFSWFFAGLVIAKLIPKE